MTAIKKPENAFTFTWSIRNFSHYAVKENESLDNPKFETVFSNLNKFNLKIFPKGQVKDASFIVYIYKEKHCDTDILFEFEIHKSNGKFKKCHVPFIFPGSNLSFGLCLLPVNEFEKQAIYLNNDTLILRCHMWKKNATLPVAITCCAQTRIKISTVIYAWTLNDFFDSKTLAFNQTITQTVKVPYFLEKVPNFEIELLIRNNEDNIHFAIHNPSENNTFFLVYAIHLLDSAERLAHSVSGQRLFEKAMAKQILDFPCLSKRKLLSNHKVYLPNGTLTLRCEFSISTTEYDVEEFEYGESKHVQIKLQPAILDSKQEPIDATEVEEKLRKECLKKFFEKGSFSDIVVRSPQQQFPVHKAVLCTHSDVFAAMFEHDMKEQNSGAVDIEDLEDDTVAKMLSYLYTGTVEAMDCSIAQKLLVAADKYEIKSLLRKCSNYLKSHLDVTNVCDVLVLSDAHQDKDLKECAMNFIVDHDLEVIDTEAWERIMETHGHLTSVTMKRIICKNLKGHKDH